MELLVYKASAGSGKTFTLAVEYIKLLILNPRAYRQILAVTFTSRDERAYSQLALRYLERGQGLGCLSETDYRRNRKTGGRSAGSS